MFLLLVVLMGGAVSLPSRQDVLRRNLQQIQQMNAEVGTEMFGVNPFVDKTDSEVAALLGVRELTVPDPTSTPHHLHQGLQQGPPAQFDWRWYGAISPPRQQAATNKVYLPAVLSTLESAYFRTAGELVEFAGRELEQCVSGTETIESYFNYIATYKHLATAKEYGAPDKCARDSTPNGMTAGLVDQMEYVTPAGSDYALINAMMRYPIMATVTVGRSWYAYASGILPARLCPAGKPNHAVQIVGYAPGYYIVKNFWGPRWGEKGYIRLERSANGNPCGLLNTMVEPAVTH